GFPLVRLAHRCEGGAAKVALSQERFTMNYPDAAPLEWSVPVSLSDAAGGQYRVLLEGASVEVAAGPCGVVLADSSGIGYYRVQDDAETFEEIAAGFEKLQAAACFGLLTDSFALVQAGRLDAG